MLFQPRTSENSTKKNAKSQAIKQIDKLITIKQLTNAFHLQFYIQEILL